MRHKAREMVPLQLRCQGRRVNVKALFDTGNTLTDPITGKPVVVLEGQRGAELLGVHATKDMFLNPAAGLEKLKRLAPDCKLRLLPYKTVGVENGLLLAAPCRAKAGRTGEIAVLAALSPCAVSDGGSYEALIGGAMF